MYVEREEEREDSSAHIEAVELDAESKLRKRKKKKKKKKSATGKKTTPRKPKPGQFGACVRSCVCMSVLSLSLSVLCALQHALAALFT
jgi:hypothetical protein